jgi:hypothetical protein
MFTQLTVNALLITPFLPLIPDVIALIQQELIRLGLALEEKVLLDERSHLCFPVTFGFPEEFYCANYTIFNEFSRLTVNGIDEVRANRFNRFIRKKCINLESTFRINQLQILSEYDIIKKFATESAKWHTFQYLEAGSEEEDIISFDFGKWRPSL